MEDNNQRGQGTVNSTYLEQRAIHLEKIINQQLEIIRSLQYQNKHQLMNKY